MLYAVIEGKEYEVEVIGEPIEKFGGRAVYVRAKSGLPFYKRLRRQGVLFPHPSESREGYVPLISVYTKGQ